MGSADYSAFKELYAGKLCEKRAGPCLAHILPKSYRQKSPESISAYMIYAARELLLLELCWSVDYVYDEAVGAL